MYQSLLDECLICLLIVFLDLKLNYQTMLIIQIKSAKFSKNIRLETKLDLKLIKSNVRIAI